jgi:hypothetical protein
MGMGEWSEDKVKTDYNLVNPPLRDTTTGQLYNFTETEFEVSVARIAKMCRRNSCAHFACC